MSANCENEHNIGAILAENQHQAFEDKKTKIIYSTTVKYFSKKKKITTRNK